MDLPPSPEKKLSSEDIPDLNVKSYYGEHIPAVEDDFGSYSYSDSSASPETFNGGVSNLSEDSLDNRLISSGLAEESEVPIIESTDVYNDSLCDVSNTKGLIDDILVNLSPPICGEDKDQSNSDDSDQYGDNESFSLSCDDSQCSCDACNQDTSREYVSPSSPLARSDDSSFASSCDSFEYPFFQSNSEYLDTKLTLSNPSHPYAISEICIKFPPLGSQNYKYNGIKNVWVPKEPVMVAVDRVIMTAKDFSAQRENSKRLLKEYPSDIVFPNNYVACKVNCHNAQSGATIPLPFSVKDSNYLGNDNGSNANVPLLRLLSPAGVPPGPLNSEFKNDNNFATEVETPNNKQSSLVKQNDIPGACKHEYSTNELSEALRNLESVKYSLENNPPEDPSSLRVQISSLILADQRNSLDNSPVEQNTASISKVNYANFNRGGNVDSANVSKQNDLSLNAVEPSSNIISVGENVITCKNPGPFTDSYSIKHYDDNCSPKDSNPNSVEYKHMEDSLDEGSTQTPLVSPEPVIYKDRTSCSESQDQINKDISDVINNLSKAVELKCHESKTGLQSFGIHEQNDNRLSTLMYKLASDSVESYSAGTAICTAAGTLDMPSLSPEPEVLASNLDMLLPPTLMPQTSISNDRVSDNSGKCFSQNVKNKKHRHERKQNKDKINHMLTKQDIHKLYHEPPVLVNSDLNNLKPRAPESVDCNLSKENIKADDGRLDASITPESERNESLKSTNLQTADEVKLSGIDTNLSEKKSLINLANLKKTEKKSQSVPKSFILGKVFPKNRVTKPEKQDESEIKQAFTVTNHKGEESELVSSVDVPNSRLLLSHCNNQQLMKIKDKNRIVVSMLGTNNNIVSNQGKNDQPIVKKTVSNQIATKNPVKAPSFCSSSSHKLVVFKKTASFLDKMGKKQSLEPQTKDKDSKQTEVNVNGYHSDTGGLEIKDTLAQKENYSDQDAQRQRVSADLKTKSENVALPAEVHPSVEDSSKNRLISSTPIAKPYIVPDKVAREKLRSPKALTRPLNTSQKEDSEKPVYNTSKTQVIRQRTESVVAEADSTGSDTSLLGDSRSEFILDKGPNLIIQNDSGSKVPISNEIRLKQSDSVRLLLDPGNLSREPNRYSMVITVATAEISCHNELEPSCNTESLKATVSTRASKSSKYNHLEKEYSEIDLSKNDNSQDYSLIKLKSEPKSLANNKSISDAVSEKKQRSSRGSFNISGCGATNQPEKPVKLELTTKEITVRTKNSDPGEPARASVSSSLEVKDQNKDTDSVSSTSCVESNNTKSKRKTINNSVKKPAEKCGKNVDSSNKNKKDVDVKNVSNKSNCVENSNLRKRSASCGAAVKEKERRHSTETGSSKKAVEILCSIELDSIKKPIKSLSLSDTCVSSLDYQHTDKNSLDPFTKKILKKGSTSSSLERHDNGVEVSSSTSPGKDDKDNERQEVLILPSVDVSLISVESSGEVKGKDDSRNPTTRNNPNVTRDKSGPDPMSNSSSLISSPNITVSSISLTKSGKISEEESTLYRNPDNPCVISITECRMVTNVSDREQTPETRTSVKKSDQTKTPPAYNNAFLNKKRSKSTPDSISSKIISGDSNVLHGKQVGSSDKSNSKRNKSESSERSNSGNSHNVSSSRGASNTSKTNTKSSTSHSSLSNSKTEKSSSDNIDKAGSSKETKKQNNSRSNTTSGNKGTGRSRSQSSQDDSKSQKKETSNTNSESNKSGRKTSKDNQSGDDKSYLRTRSSFKEIFKESDKSKPISKDKKSGSEGKLYDKDKNNSLYIQDQEPKGLNDSSISESKTTVKQSKQNDTSKLKNNDTSPSVNNKKKSELPRENTLSGDPAKSSAISSQDSVKSEPNVGLRKKRNDQFIDNSDSRKGKGSLKIDSEKNKIPSYPSNEHKKSFKSKSEGNLASVLSSIIERGKAINSSKAKTVSGSSLKSKNKTEEIPVDKPGETPDIEPNPKRNQKSDNNPIEINVVKTNLRSRSKLQRDVNFELEKSVFQFTKIKTKAALKDFGSSKSDSNDSGDIVTEVIVCELHEFQPDDTKKSKLLEVVNPERNTSKDHPTKKPNPKSKNTSKSTEKLNTSKNDESALGKPKKGRNDSSENLKLNLGKRSSATSNKSNIEKNKLKETLNSSEDSINKSKNVTDHSELSSSDERMSLRKLKGSGDLINKIEISKVKIVGDNISVDNFQITTSCEPEQNRNINTRKKDLLTDAKEKEKNVKQPRRPSTLTAELSKECPNNNNPSLRSDKKGNNSLNVPSSPLSNTNPDIKNSQNSTSLKRSSSGSLKIDLSEGSVTPQNKVILMKKQLKLSDDISLDRGSRSSSSQSRTRSRSSPPPYCEIKKYDISYNSNLNISAKDLKESLNSGEPIKSPSDRKLRSSSNLSSSESLTVVECSKNASSSQTGTDKKIRESELQLGDKIRSTRRSKSNSESSDVLSNMGSNLVDHVIQKSNEIIHNKAEKISPSKPCKNHNSDDKILIIKDKSISISFSSTTTDVSDIPLPSSPPLTVQPSSRSNKSHINTTNVCDLKLDVSEIPLPKSPPPSRRSLRCQGKVAPYQLTDEYPAMFDKAKSPKSERKIAYKNIINDDDFYKTTPSTPVKTIGKDGPVSKDYSKTTIIALNSSLNPSYTSIKDCPASKVIISKSDMKESGSTPSVDSVTCERRSSLRLQERLLSPTRFPVSRSEGEDTQILKSNDTDPGYLNDDKEPSQSTSPSSIVNDPKPSSKDKVNNSDPSPTGLTGLNKSTSLVSQPLNECPEYIEPSVKVISERTDKVEKNLPVILSTNVLEPLKGVKSINDKANIYEDSMTEGKADQSVSSGISVENTPCTQNIKTRGLSSKDLEMAGSPSPRRTSSRQSTKDSIVKLDLELGLGHQSSLSVRRSPRRFQIIKDISFNTISSEIKIDSLGDKNDTPLSKTNQSKVERVTSDSKNTQVPEKDSKITQTPKRDEFPNELLGGNLQLETVSRLGKPEPMCNDSKLTQAPEKDSKITQTTNKEKSSEKVSGSKRPECFNIGSLKQLKPSNQRKTDLISSNSKITQMPEKDSKNTQTSDKGSEFTDPECRSNNPSEVSSDYLVNISDSGRMDTSRAQAKPESVLKGRKFKDNRAESKTKISFKNTDLLRKLLNENTVSEETHRSPKTVKNKTFVREELVVCKIQEPVIITDLPQPVLIRNDISLCSDEKHPDFVIKNSFSDETITVNQVTEGNLTNNYVPNESFDQANKIIMSAPILEHESDTVLQKSSKNYKRKSVRLTRSKKVCIESSIACTEAMDKNNTLTESKVQLESEVPSREEEEKLDPSSSDNSQISLQNKTLLDCFKNKSIASSYLTDEQISKTNVACSTSQSSDRVLISEDSTTDSEVSLLKAEAFSKINPALLHYENISDNTGELHSEPLSDSINVTTPTFQMSDISENTLKHPVMSSEIVCTTSGTSVVGGPVISNEPHIEFSVLTQSQNSLLSVSNSTVLNPVTRPLYETIISNTIDYALVSPSSDAVLGPSDSCVNPSVDLFPDSMYKSMTKDSQSAEPIITCNNLTSLSQGSEFNDLNSEVCKSDFNLLDNNHTVANLAGTAFTGIPGSTINNQIDYSKDNSSTNITGQLITGQSYNEEELAAVLPSSHATSCHITQSDIGIMNSNVDSEMNAFQDLTPDDTAGSADQSFNSDSRSSNSIIGVALMFLNSPERDVGSANEQPPLSANAALFQSELNRCINSAIDDNIELDTSLSISNPEQYLSFNDNLNSKVGLSNNSFDLDSNTTINESSSGILQESLFDSNCCREGPLEVNTNSSVHLKPINQTRSLRDETRDSLADSRNSPDNENPCNNTKISHDSNVTLSDHAVLNSSDLDTLNPAEYFLVSAATASLSVDSSFGQAKPKVSQNQEDAFKDSILNITENTIDLSNNETMVQSSNADTDSLQNQQTDINPTENKIITETCAAQIMSDSNLNLSLTSKTLSGGNDSDATNLDSHNCANIKDIDLPHKYDLISNTSHLEIKSSSVPDAITEQTQHVQEKIRSFSQDLSDFSSQTNENFKTSNNVNVVINEEPINPNSEILSQDIFSNNDECYNDKITANASKDNTIIYTNSSENILSQDIFLGNDERYNENHSSNVQKSENLIKSNIVDDSVALASLDENLTCDALNKELHSNTDWIPQIGSSSSNNSVLENQREDLACGAVPDENDTSMMSVSSQITLTDLPQKVNEVGIGVPPSSLKNNDVVNRAFSVESSSSNDRVSADSDTLTNINEEAKCPDISHQGDHENSGESIKADEVSVNKTPDTLDDPTVDCAISPSEVRTVQAPLNDDQCVENREQFDKSNDAFSTPVNIIKDSPDEGFATLSEDTLCGSQNENKSSEYCDTGSSLNLSTLKPLPEECIVIKYDCESTSILAVDEAVKSLDSSPLVEIVPDRSHDNTVESTLDIVDHLASCKRSDDLNNPIEVINIPNDEASHCIDNSSGIQTTDLSSDNLDGVFEDSNYSIDETEIPTDLVVVDSLIELDLAESESQIAITSSPLTTDSSDEMNLGEKDSGANQSHDEQISDGLGNPSIRINSSQEIILSAHNDKFINNIENLTEGENGNFLKNTFTSDISLPTEKQIDFTVSEITRDDDQMSKAQIVDNSENISKTSVSNSEKEEIIDAPDSKFTCDIEHLSEEQISIHDSKFINNVKHQSEDQIINIPEKLIDTVQHLSGEQNILVLDNQITKNDEQPIEEPITINTPENKFTDNVEHLAEKLIIGVPDDQFSSDIEHSSKQQIIDDHDCKFIINVEQQSEEQLIDVTDNKCIRANESSCKTVNVPDNTFNNNVENPSEEAINVPDNTIINNNKNSSEEDAVNVPDNTFTNNNENPSEEEAINVPDNTFTNNNENPSEEEAINVHDNTFTTNVENPSEEQAINVPGNTFTNNVENPSEEQAINVPDNTFTNNNENPSEEKAINVPDSTFTNNIDNPSEEQAINVPENICAKNVIHPSEEQVMNVSDNSFTSNVENPSEELVIDVLNNSLSSNTENPPEEQGINIPDKKLTNIVENPSEDQVINVPDDTFKNNVENSPEEQIINVSASNVTNESVHSSMEQLINVPGQRNDSTNAYVSDKQVINITDEEVSHGIDNSSEKQTTDAADNTIVIEDNHSLGEGNINVANNSFEKPLKQNVDISIDEFTTTDDYLPNDVASDTFKAMSDDDNSNMSQSFNITDSDNFINNQEKIEPIEPKGSDIVEHPGADNLRNVIFTKQSDNHSPSVLDQQVLNSAEEIMNPGEAVFNDPSQNASKMEDGAGPKYQTEVAMLVCNNFSEESYDDISIGNDEANDLTKEKDDVIGNYSPINIKKKAEHIKVGSYEMDQTKDSLVHADNQIYCSGNPKIKTQTEEIVVESQLNTCDRLTIVYGTNQSDLNLIADEHQLKEKTVISGESVSIKSDITFMPKEVNEGEQSNQQCVTVTKLSNNENQSVNIESDHPSNIESINLDDLKQSIETNSSVCDLTTSSNHIVTTLSLDEERRINSDDLVSTPIGSADTITMVDLTDSDLSHPTDTGVLEIIPNEIAAVEFEIDVDTGCANDLQGAEPANLASPNKTDMQSNSPSFEPNASDSVVISLSVPISDDTAVEAIDTFDGINETVNKREEAIASTVYVTSEKLVTSSDNSISLTTAVDVPMTHSIKNDAILTTSTVDNTTVSDMMALSVIKEPESSNEINIMVSPNETFSINDDKISQNSLVSSCLSDNTCHDVINELRPPDNYRMVQDKVDSDLTVDISVLPEHNEAIKTLSDIAINVDATKLSDSKSVNVPKDKSNELFNSCERNAVDSQSKGIAESPALNSPESTSTPSPPLIISPLSVNMYHSSDDSDYCPPNSSGQSFSVVGVESSSRSITIPSKTVVERHLDVTVVNPLEDSTEKLPQMDVVVVSPSSLILSSPGEGKDTCSADKDDLDSEEIFDVTVHKEPGSPNTYARSYWRSSSRKSMRSPTFDILSSDLLMPRDVEHNASTEEEILNELMSSVVGTRGVEISDSSESEHSPRPNILQSGLDGRGKLNLNLFPDSVESANYKKRKIKALRETDFVKKRKHYHNSGNIIIHSSEDEGMHEREGNDKQRGLVGMEQSNTPEGMSKPPEGSSNKFANPYSKIFYHKRNRGKNDRESDFSFKSLFSCRKRRSNCKIVKNSDLNYSSNSVEHSSKLFEINQNFPINNPKHLSKGSGFTPPIAMLGRNRKSSVLKYSTNPKNHTDQSKTLSNVTSCNVVINSSFSSCNADDKKNLILPKEDSIPPSFVTSPSQNGNVLNTSCRLASTLSTSNPDLNNMNLDLKCKNVYRARSQSVDSNFYYAKKNRKVLTPIELAQSPHFEKSLSNTPGDTICDNLNRKNTGEGDIHYNIDSAMLKLMGSKELRVALNRIDVSKYLSSSNDCFKDIEIMTVDRDQNSPLNLMDELAPSQSSGIFLPYLRDNPDVFAELQFKTPDEGLEDNSSTREAMDFLGDEIERDGSDTETEYHEQGSKNKRSGAVYLSGNTQVSGFVGSRYANQRSNENSLHTDFENPIRSRPASPCHLSDLGCGIPTVRVTRLNLNNLRDTMRSASVKTVSVPSYFLHLKQGVTNVRLIPDTNKYFVDIIDEGPILKVVANINSLEMFYIDVDSGDIRHPHLSVDSCGCPFSRRLRLPFLRGWQLLEEETRKECEKILVTDNAGPSIKIKKAGRPKRKIFYNKRKILDMPPFNREKMEPSDSNLVEWNSKKIIRTEEPSSNHSSAFNENYTALSARFESSLAGKENPPRVMLQTDKHVGKVPPQESSTSYAGYQPISSSSSLPRSRVSAAPPRNLSNPQEMDIVCIKGMIKKKKGSDTKTREFDSLSFGSIGDDVVEKKFETDHCIVDPSLMANNQNVEPNALLDDLELFPMNNYNEFLRQRTEEEDKIGDATQNLLEKQAEKSSKGQAVQREFERTLKLDKRKPDDTEVTQDKKRPRLMEQKATNISHLSGEADVGSVEAEKSINQTAEVSIPPENNVIKDLLPNDIGQPSNSSKKRASEVDVGEQRPVKKLSKRVSRRRKELLEKNQNPSMNVSNKSIPNYIALAATNVIGHSIPLGDIDLKKRVDLTIKHGVQGNHNRCIILMNDPSLITNKEETRQPVKVTKYSSPYPCHQTWVKKKTTAERVALIKSLTRVDDKHFIFPSSTTATSSSYKTDQKLSKSNDPGGGDKYDSSTNSDMSDDDFNRFSLKSRHNLHPEERFIVYDPDTLDKESNSQYGDGEMTDDSSPELLSTAGDV